MTDERTIAVIEAEIIKAEQERKEIGIRIANLKRELGETKVRLAPSHPYAGKKVRRVFTQYGRSKVQRGVVTQNTHAHTLFGKIGHSPQPGEWYVASPSGRTAYSASVTTAATAWELEA